MGVVPADLCGHSAVTARFPVTFGPASAHDGVHAAWRVLDNFGMVCVGMEQDMVYVGVPIVTLAGDMWRNRIGAAILRRVGLSVSCCTRSRHAHGRLIRCLCSPSPLPPREASAARFGRDHSTLWTILSVVTAAVGRAQELVASTEDEFVSIATRLIISRHALQDVKSRVVATDLSPLLDDAPARLLPPLFRTLIDEHPTSELTPPLPNTNHDECVRVETALVRAAVRTDVNEAYVNRTVASACSTGSGEARLPKLSGDSRSKNALGGPLRAGVPVNVTALLSQRGLLPL